MSFSSRFHIAFDTAFHRLVMKYKVGVLFMLKRKWLAGILLLIACGGFAVLMMTTKTGLVPNEDMGTIYVDVRTSPGSSLQETRIVEDAIDAVMDKISRSTAFISSADIMPFTRPMIPGYGASSGFELYVQDQKGGSIEDLLKYTRQIIDELKKRPENVQQHRLIPNSRSIYWK